MPPSYNMPGFQGVAGGALAQIMALHHMRNGLFANVDTVSLVLFNAPTPSHCRRPMLFFVILMTPAVSIVRQGPEGSQDLVHGLPWGTRHWPIFN